MENFVDVKLSDHFFLSELIVTQQRTVDNTPSPEILQQLKRLCATAEYIRYALGNRPMYITSGYRCPPLNCIVGGAMTAASLRRLEADTPSESVVWYAARNRLLKGRYSFSDSAHMLGLAIDFTAPSFGNPWETCRKLEVEMQKGMAIDQLIYEHTWVHVGLDVDPQSNRREILTANADGTYSHGINRK